MCVVCVWGGGEVSTYIGFGPIMVCSEDENSDSSSKRMQEEDKDSEEEEQRRTMMSCGSKMQSLSLSLSL